MQTSLHSSDDGGCYNDHDRGRMCYAQPHYGPLQMTVCMSSPKP